MLCVQRQIAIIINHHCYFLEHEHVTGDVNEQIVFSSDEFQFGLYLLGVIPINGSVTRFCVFGEIQTIGLTISKVNTTEIRGRIRIYIAHENVYAESMMDIGPYNILQPWNSSEMKCLIPHGSPVEVMESDRVYVLVQRRCIDNLICPLQVNYKSNETIPYANIRSRNDAEEGITNNNLGFVSDMMSLNVQVTVMAGI